MRTDPAYTRRPSRRVAAFIAHHPGATALISIVAALVVALLIVGTSHNPSGKPASHAKPAPHNAKAAPHKAKPVAKAPTDGSQGWSDSFQSGDFSGWSWWGGGPPSGASPDPGQLWGHIAVVSAASEGIPALDGNRVARFETTPSDIAAGRINAKLYKSFYRGGPSLFDHRPPADVSGSYSVYYYFPSDYRVPPGAAVNIFQFKENFKTTDASTGGAVSKPSYWIQVEGDDWARKMGGPVTARSDAPVAFVSWPTNGFKGLNYVPVPLGRWVQFRAEVHQGDRIDFFMDGRPLQTVHQSDYPVGPFHGSASLDWTFGIGAFGNGLGPIYADDASFKPAGH